MSSDGAGAVTIRAAEASDMRVVRALFSEYAGTLGFELDFQDFDSELATLPGAYAPPGGALLLAEIGEEPVGWDVRAPGMPGGRCRKGSGSGHHR